MQQLPGLSFAAVLAIIIALSVPGAGQTECEADHNCPLTEYCYDKTGYCTPCFDCRFYKRYPSKYQNCAKGFEDCGSCVKGYTEEVLTGYEKRHFCKPTPTTAAPIEKTDSTNNEPTVWYWAIAAVIAIVAIGIFLIVLCYRKYNKSPATAANWMPASEVPLMTSPLPPPYSEITITMPSDPLYPSPLPPSSPKPPSAPQLETVMQDSCVNRIHERGENGNQKASRYIKPRYMDSEDNSLETDDPAFAPQLPQAAALDNPNPNPDLLGDEHTNTDPLDDEDTNPSSWVPGNQRSESNQAAETRVTLDDSGNSSMASLNDTVGSTAQGTVVTYRRNFELPPPTAPVNGLRRSLSSPEPQNTAKKPRSDSGCSQSSNEAWEEPDTTDLPQAPNINNNSSAVINNNIIVYIDNNRQL